LKYEFLIDTYETERMKVLSAWSEFRNEDLPMRPLQTDLRGRSVHEQMVHQCVSEDTWFRSMLQIEVGASPLPRQESRTGFMKRYAEDSGKRLAMLRQKDEDWWEGQTKFFDVDRSSVSAQGINDAQIASIVVTANQVDIDAGRLAVSRSRSDDVKVFARLMVTMDVW
jgi:uncharacterized protein DUF4142